MGAILAANPHRVFLSRVGRVEVYQRIPPPDGKIRRTAYACSPQAVTPQTHSRGHGSCAGRMDSVRSFLSAASATGCLRPSSILPIRNATRLFKRSVARYGDRQIVDIKRRVVEAVAAGRGPPDVGIAADRFARAAVRVALRQLQAVKAGFTGPGGLALSS